MGSGALSGSAPPGRVEGRLHPAAPRTGRVARAVRCCAARPWGWELSLASTLGARGSWEHPFVGRITFHAVAAMSESHG